ncbi:chemotaxis protein CheD [Clostridiaceae bacterium HSG29]|nr:chemotaxis protein CheD [Clostridiaceae bacterium HSG29]
MGEIIKVGMADLKVTKYPNSLTTLGLGSCVGICLYDKKTKLIGMAHIMLPSSKQIRNNKNKYKFADTALVLIIEEMKKKGTMPRNLVAKIAGGAKMFNFNSTSESMNVGQRNSEAVRELLELLKIELIADDCGGNFGRTIIFDSENGGLLVKTIGHGIETI